MYKNIIVPLAFDDEHKPDAALQAVKALAAPGAKVTLVHIMADVPGYAMSYMPPGYTDELKETLQTSLNTIAKGFDNADTILSEGSPATEILRIAEDSGADCIVIASHRPGFGDYLIGSTAARVVRHAHCSVLVMR
ncbi:MAG TPA: universal stress protein [Paenirhodobacter sp.]